MPKSIGSQVVCCWIAWNVKEHAMAHSVLCVTGVPSAEMANLSKAALWVAWGVLGH